MLEVLIEGVTNLITSSHDPSSCVIPTLIYLLFQESKPTVENDFETQKLQEWLPHLHDQKNIGPADRSNCDDYQLLSEGSNAKQSGKILIIAFCCTHYPDDDSLLSPPALAN